MNVRIISATHQALENMVPSGHFRQDFLCRLNVPNLPWVGNIRQLQNVIFRAVTMTEGNIIQVGDLELAQEATPALPGDSGEVSSLDQAVADFEKALLQRLYLEFPSSRRLAKRLGTSHSAITKRLRRYGIPPE